MYLGIDTSCYTTSIAVLSNEHSIIADKRKILEVRQGEKGLRQSDGVFQHLKNLPLLIEDIKEYMPEIRCVCVSAAPRRAEGSYMPVFTVGSGFASCIANTLNIPLIKTTHQEGHIMAAISTSGGRISEKFIAVHISGGTTEILLCKPDEQGFETEIIGKTLDLPVGQLVDRIGVSCGYSFPCGKQMDQAVKIGSIRLPVTVKDCNINFSGGETVAKKMIEAGDNHGEIFYAVFDCIAHSLEKALKNAMERYKVDDILMVGGVAANSIIKAYLERQFRNIYFTKACYCTDNSVGVSGIAQMRYK